MASRHRYFPVKLELPVDLIRQVDQLIRVGRTPFATRDEFIAEAIQQLLVELRSDRRRSQLELRTEFPSAAASPGTMGFREPLLDADSWEEPLEPVPVTDAAFTALEPV